MKSFFKALGWCVAAIIGIIVLWIWSIVDSGSLRFWAIGLIIAWFAYGLLKVVVVDPLRGEILELKYRLNSLSKQHEETIDIVRRIYGHLYRDRHPTNL